MKKRFEYIITLIYLFTGGIWILFSDKVILMLVENVETLTKLQTYKGWFYVLVNGLLLFIIIKSYLKKQRKAEADLIKERNKAEENNELKSAFIANISHEIRTPMNAIIGFSDLLNKPQLPEDKRIQYGRYISKNGKQLLAIVNNLLDISRIESKKIDLIQSEFSLNELMQDIYESFRAEAESRFLDLMLEKNVEKLNDIIYADKTKLHQILSNLISNAIKFTKKGFIKFGYYFEEQYVKFYVEDTGIGIDRENHNEIFEAFKQVETGLSQKYGGTGLGLSICKSYIDLMNGQIWINSEKGRGSRFYFTIPYHSLKSNRQQTSQKPALKDWKDKTILVAEDEDSNFEYVNELLLETHVNLLHAKNGQDAIELCISNDKIDLVLMDIKMPVVHGLNAAREIKKKRPGLPIIAQTAFAMRKDRENASSAGCDDFIAKPLDAEHLISLISQYL